jgi:NSS family neurotransmitter:Na+ symporter
MILMPVLAALMVGLALYSAIEGDVAATLRFLFSLDPAHLTARAALEALGLGFFSIGVGLGLMIAYSAYAGPEISLRQVAVVSVVADCVISLLAGFVVFPLVFAQGLDPASGPGLVFVTVPIAFARMPFGTLAAVAFFLLLFIAALASAVSMLELVVGFLSHGLRWSRRRASLIAGAAAFMAGIGTCLSFNLWAGWHPLRRVEGFQSATCSFRSVVSGSRSSRAGLPPRASSPASWGSPTRGRRACAGSCAGWFRPGSSRQVLRRCSDSAVI